MRHPALVMRPLLMSASYCVLTHEWLCPHTWMSALHLTWVKHNSHLNECIVPHTWMHMSAYSHWVHYTSFMRMCIHLHIRHIMCLVERAQSECINHSCVRYNALRTPDLVNFLPGTKNLTIRVALEICIYFKGRSKCMSALYLTHEWLIAHAWMQAASTSCAMHMNVSYVALKSSWSKAGVEPGHQEGPGC